MIIRWLTQCPTNHRAITKVPYAAPREHRMINPVVDAVTPTNPRFITTVPYAATLPDSTG